MEKLVHLGDLDKVLPLAAALAAWLLAARAWRITLRWLLLFGAALGVVGISKIAFLGWGTALHALDFKAISGHATCVTALYPFFAYVVLYRPDLAESTNGAGSVQIGTMANAASAANARKTANAGKLANSGEVSNPGEVPNPGEVSNRRKVANAGKVADPGNVANAGTVTPAGTVANAGKLAEAGYMTSGRRINKTGGVANPGGVASGESVIGRMREITGGGTGAGARTTAGARPLAARMGLLAGLSLGGIVSALLVTSGEHSVAEALAGWLLGAAVSLGSAMTPPDLGGGRMLPTVWWTIPVFALAASLMESAHVGYWMIRMALALSGSARPYPWDTCG